MINLFKMEMLRHRSWMMGAALTHFLILSYLFWLGTPFTNGLGASGWLMASCVFAGAFGVVQMKLYRRSNDWAYLLHRPLEPRSIHAALLLSGCVVLALVLLIPALLMLVVMQIDGRFGTEFRHYQIAALCAATALTAYGVGQFAVLSASRLAFLAVVFACIFVYQPFGNTERVITHTLLMFWALAIAHVSFKSDLARLPEKTSTLLLTELAVVLGCYMIISMVFGVYTMSQRTSSTVFGNPAPDSFARITALDDKSRLQLALGKSTHADAEFLMQQASLGEIVRVPPPQRSSYPERHQLPLRDDKLILSDSRTNITWLFHHSSMLYVGRDNTSGAPAGWLAPDGFHTPDAGQPDVRFSSIPLVATNDYLVDDHHIYQIDWDELTLTRRFTNKDNERFSDSLYLSENIATIFSDHHLYIFNAADLLDTNIPLEPRATLEISLPTADGNEIPGAVSVVELINGYLVFAFVDPPPLSNVPDFVMQGKGSLQVWRLLPGSDSELVASVPLSSSYSEFSRYVDLVLSPGIRSITDMFWGYKLRLPAERTFSVLHVDFPRWVIIGMLFVCLFCAGITAWLLRNSKLPPKTRNFWIAMAGFSGLPGLMAFVLGHYWGGRDRLRLPLPATGAELTRVPT